MFRPERGGRGGMEEGLVNNKTCRRGCAESVKRRLRKSKNNE